jgi:pilus assembly protein Flp/PilA
VKQFVINVVPVVVRLCESNKLSKEKRTMLTYAMILVQNYLATLKREEGQGMAEYGLLLGIIAVGAIAAIALIGDEVLEIFSGFAVDFAAR